MILLSFVFPASAPINIAQLTKMVTCHCLFYFPIVITDSNSLTT